MSTNEQSKEMAIFCQNEAKKRKKTVFKTWFEKAVLQGVMVAFLAISTGPGGAPEKSEGWVTD